MVRLVENARRKLCEIVEINDDTAETLDDLINAVSVKLSWDTGEIGLDRKCQVKCVNL